MTKKKKVPTKKEVEEMKVAMDKKAKEEKKGIAFASRLRLANKKQDYIRNIINGRYYMSRCNMIAVQIQGKNILEDIDGCPKSEEFLRAEYALHKMQAIISMRNAHFAKQELFSDFKLKEKDIQALEEDYYDGKIIREAYNESYQKGNKAEFVNSSED